MLATIALALLTAPQIDKDVVYSTVGDEKLMMDIYHPSEPSKKPVPAIVVIHGGAWSGGKREDMAPVCEFLTKEGFVAATIEYRLAPKYKYPTMIDDSQTAVRYLRANAKKLGINPKKMGACGASAGGHLSLLLGVTDTRDPKPGEYPKESSKVQAVFDMFGPTDLSIVADYPKYLDPVFVNVLGKKRELAAEEIKAASPINYVSRGDAPVFIFQGLKDPLVSPNQSRIFEAKYKEMHLPVEAHYVEGVGHELPVEKPAVMEAVNQGIAFLKKYLGK